MISVCIASYNGGSFIREQLQSILTQLTPADEVIVSDDDSSDETVKIVRSLMDNRIKIVTHSQRQGPTMNFENALRHARGEIIFLSDQDDLWLDSKVNTVVAALQDADLVVTDCKIVDEHLTIQSDSYFQKVNGKTGLLRNLTRTSPYMGCCMAFRKQVLDAAMPFPAGIPLHDFWIALVAETFFRVKFIHQPLLLYRRHSQNASRTGSKSTNSLIKRIGIRTQTLAALFGRVLRELKNTRRRAHFLFVLFSCLVSICLFLPAGFLTASVILLLLSCLAHRRDPRVTEYLPKTLFVPIVLFLMYLVWLLFSNYPDDGVGRLGVKLSLLVVPAGFLWSRPIINRRDLNIILGTFLVACILTSMTCYGFAIAQIIEHKSLVPANQERAYFYYSYEFLAESVNFSPIYLSLYSNFALAIALVIPSVQGRTIRIAVVGYLIVFVLLLASKMGVIVLAALLVIWTIWTIHRKRYALSLAAVIIVLFILGLTQLPFLKERFILTTNYDYASIDPRQWNSTTERLAIWSCCKEALKGHVLAGYGTGAGQKALEAVYVEKGFARGTQTSYNPHNEYISTCLDLGIGGVLVLLTLVFYPAAKTLRERDTLTFFFILICALFFGVESFLLRQKGVMFFSFFYSLLLWPQKQE